MSRLTIRICRIDDESKPDQLTELDRIDVPPLDARYLQKDTALDHLEAQTLVQGHEVMRHLLLRQWERVDDQLAESYRELFSPQTGDGGRPREDQSGQPDGDPVAASPGARTHRRERPRGAGE